MRKRYAYERERERERERGIEGAMRALLRKDVTLKTQAEAVAYKAVRSCEVFIMQKKTSRTSLFLTHCAVGYN